MPKEMERCKGHCYAVLDSNWVDGYCPQCHFKRHPEESELSRIDRDIERLQIDRERRDQCESCLCRFLFVPLLGILIILQIRLWLQ